MRLGGHRVCLRMYDCMLFGARCRYAGNFCLADFWIAGAWGKHAGPLSNDVDRGTRTMPVQTVHDRSLVLNRNLHMSII